MTHLTKFYRKAIIAFIAAICFYNCNSSYAQITANHVWTHPGVMNSKAELDFIKAKILAGANPWKRIYDNMRLTNMAYTKTTAPLDLGNATENEQKADAQKCYINALYWYVSGDVTYANNAINILNVWANTFQGYSTTLGQNQLDASWIGAIFAPAAEIMRAYSGWTPTQLASTVSMFKTKFAPTLNRQPIWANGNIDLTMAEALMGIAVFCEDVTLFNAAVNKLNRRIPLYFYLTADGSPTRLSNYAEWGSYHAVTKWVDGLTQETCRDVDHHAQFAMAAAFHAAEIAYHQNVDVYTPNTDRFVATLELMAQQIQTGSMQGTCGTNGSQDVTTTDIFNTWEVGYNHYFNRKGIALPNTLSLLTSGKNMRANASISQKVGKIDWNIFYETLTHDLDGFTNTTCPTPALGADVTICGQTSLTLNSAVKTGNKTIKWYKDNVLIPNESNITYIATQAGTYKVTVDSSTCSNSDEIVVSGTLTVNLGTAKELCNPSSFTLDAGNSSVPSVTYLWSTGEKTRTKIASKAGTYSVAVSAPNCATVNSSVVITSKLINVSNDTICKAGPVNLVANGTSTYKWYDVKTGGAALGINNIFNPSIVNNSVYYVEETGGFTGSLGRVVKGAGEVWTVSGTDFTAADKTLNVTVEKALTLNSLAVYVTNANTSVTINFMQGTTVAFTKTFANLPAGKQTLTLDFDLKVGNYVINAAGTTGSLDLEAANSTPTFPYSIAGYLSFTNNASWANVWYGSFYDWKISTGSPCERTPVYAVIDQSICVTDIQNIDENNFNLFPNPVKDILTVTGVISKIRILNIMGETIYSESNLNNNSSTSIDVSGFKSGIYFIEINNVKQKFIVNN